MLRLAVYGKGGIGKSTTVCCLSAAFAQKGMRVMQIGCDPKSDSTALLMGGKKIETVLDCMRREGGCTSLEPVTGTGFAGVVCAETGGPLPGTGCAGRGVAAALEHLGRLGAYSVFSPDMVFYDVLGDVVCGGFSMPMRKGYADHVAVMTSGERMALYAASNIARAVKHFAGRGYADLAGFILVRRGTPGEDEAAREMAETFNSSVIGALSWSRCVQEAEHQGKTVMEAFPESPMAGEYRALADALAERLGVRTC